LRFFPILIVFFKTIFTRHTDKLAGRCNEGNAAALARGGGHYFSSQDIENNPFRYFLLGFNPLITQEELLNGFTGFAENFEMS